MCIFLSGKPDPCERIEVLEITRTSATVGWVRPARDGGAKIDGYVIEYTEVKPPPEPPAPVEVGHFMLVRSHLTTFTLDTRLQKDASRCLFSSSDQKGFIKL